MKKFLKVMLIILLCASLAAMLLFGAEPAPIATSDNPFGLVGLGVRPEGASISIDMTKNSRELALELYLLASLKDKMADHRAFFSICPTSNVAMGMDNSILLNILEIKNGQEYFRIDYRLKDSIPLFNFFPTVEQQLNEAIRLVTTERRYMHTNMDHTRYQIITNAQTNEDGIPFADWSNTNAIEESTDPEADGSSFRIFSKHQEGDYFKSAHVVELDTIEEASVEYNEEGYYEVYIKLDMALDEFGNNKATEFTRPLIREGANSDNANYTKIELELQIWDNGYFKEFKSTEFWSGTVMSFITVSSKFYYHDVYSYDIADCNIAKYYANGEFIDNY